MQVSRLLGGKEVPKTACTLIYSACSKIKAQTRSHLPIVIEYITEGLLDSEFKVACALDYLLSEPGTEVDLKVRAHPLGEEYGLGDVVLGLALGPKLPAGWPRTCGEGTYDFESRFQAFEKASGVGVTVSPEEIENAVSILISKYKSELVENRYRFNVGTLLAEARAALKFADGKSVKSEVDVQVLHLLGPKTDEDLQQRIVKKSKPAAAAKVSSCLQDNLDSSSF